MKKFLLRISLFVLVLFIVDKGFYYFLYKAPELEYDQRLEKVINGKINKDIIVLGSSRGAGNIIASQIEKETNLSSYNLSYIGSNVLFQEFILKSVLKFNKKPKKVILSIDNTYEFVFEKTLNFKFDKLYPLSKYNYINNELIDRKERSIISKVFCLGRLSKNSFILKKEEIPTKNPILPCGSMPFVEKSKDTKIEFLKDIKKYDSKKELPEKLKAFKNIQTICKENNIQLIFALPPNFNEFNTDFEKRFRKLMLPENKIIIYNRKNPIYKNQEYYFDALHLFKNGATVFTSEISAFINQNR
ncbi:hypothetical protein [Flavobacterium urocaniciphilum]|uniref:DUF1574 domain-containing protein n=1 Tax=Flavobacterium urocaniciphilum TaxID=1299341 RepID=A0A1H8YRP5_9FLAO|nr:hypothetical protein [Flavobacterium urocaniciphilum]SEP54894.1 hypothetical protein SAMN05444005_10183 [Flavobacterium urocaniciphilum]